ncbi:MAG: methyltransferase [Methanobacteriota archaeon]|nr:MAG: methyltransferase [Euryarchaeota archaeon]
MTARERIVQTINHKEADRVPLDLGGCGQTGMHVDTVYKLRQALGLDEPGTPVKVIEPYQMLGEIKLDLIEKLGVDVVSLEPPGTIFGFKKEGWKPWTTFGDTPVLVPEAFNTELDSNGDLLMYAAGDPSYPPSAKMPAGGFYFDSIPRQYPIDDAKLNIEDNLEEFGPLPDDNIQYLHTESKCLYESTDKAIMMIFPNAAFGDVALVPGPMLKDPKGIRAVDEWYMSTITRFDYVYKVFERQCEIALANLEKVYQAVENRPTTIWLSGTDFGAQNGPLISPKSYRKLYMPHYKRLTDWIHKNTTWKVFVHCCGSIMPLIQDFIDSGFDILNPVQTSSKNMDPQTLKDKFGDQLTFWGGGVDTQKTLPFGTPDQVRQQVRENIRILGKGGGFVFNPIHNVQALVPIENLLAMYETVQKVGKYSR